jgi:hypothetical protein
MRTTLPTLTRTMILQGGTQLFTHAGISATATLKWDQAQLQLLAVTRARIIRN